MPRLDAKKVAVIGLDGMPWYILNKHLECGAMPNLKCLLKYSVRGVLKSTVPPATAPAWTSIVSGVNPAKHGVFDFISLTKKFETRFVTSHDVHYPRLHEMLAIKGSSSIVVNLPFTYPITKMKKTMIVSDWIGPELCFYPKALKECAQTYLPYSSPSEFGEKDDYINALYPETVGRVNAVNKMMEELKWELFWVIYNEPDHLMHLCYDDVIKCTNSIAKIFHKLDETIGKASEIADLILIVSDHGMSKVKLLLNINSFLDKLGLVSTTSIQKIKETGDLGHRERHDQFVKVPPKVYRVVSAKPVKFMVKKFLKIITGKNFKARLPFVDPERSKAFMTSYTCYGIYVNDPSLINHVIDSLKKLKGISKVWRREELFHGPYMEKAPHIIFVPDWEMGYGIGTRMVAPNIISERLDYQHTPYGIFMAYNKDLPPSTIGEIGAVDIAPTILNFLELPIPTDTDGKLISSIVKIPNKPKYFDYLRHWKLIKPVFSKKKHLYAK